MHVCILGSGIVGLTTALELQKEFSDIRITVVADKFDEETTSSCAAGIFRPGSGFSGPTEEITKRWISNSFDYWDNIRLSSEAALAGVAQLSGYIFSSTTPDIVRNHHMEKVVPLYRRATEEELTLCGGNWKHGSFFTTNIIDCKYQLPWATEKFKNAGGKILRRKVNRFVDLYGKYDMIVNCSGFGAKTLCGDNKIIPIRGQILKVHAPWLKTAFYGDYDTYMIPGFDSVTLGGCRQYESFDMNISKHDSAAIKERAYAMLPSMAKAPIIKEMVGLRPHRDIVRVEPEMLYTVHGNMRIIHNYGHGGYGVSTAPGTSKYAVELLKNLHRRIPYRSSKL